jgi:hypothetical protein
LTRLLAVAYVDGVRLPRSKKRVKLSSLRSLAKLQVTEREAAAFFGMKLPTFLELLRVDARARDIWEQGRQLGKISLRRKQLALAETSAPMAVFLGKQWLNQQDVIVSEIQGPGGGPIPMLDFAKLTPEERKSLRSLVERSRKT